MVHSLVVVASYKGSEISATMTLPPRYNGGKWNFIHGVQSIETTHLKILKSNMLFQI